MSLKNFDRFSVMSKRSMTHLHKDEIPETKKSLLISKENGNAKLAVSNIVKMGKIVTLFPLENHDVVKFNIHTCGQECIKDNDIFRYREMNVLSIPMYLGFERHVCKINHYGAQLIVCYRAPCGRMLRSLSDVYIYIQRTCSSLKITYFSFSPEVFPFRLFTAPKEECLWSDEDVTKGVEKYPIPCINTLMNEQPPPLEYITEPIPGEDVPLKRNNEFLCHCDCTDNCLDSSTCQCQQLTSQIYSNNSLKVGYHFRRLKQYIVTGIYECNSQCPCSAEKCLNRVVQNGLEVRLQLFKTEKKGWGIQCIDDLDAGTFLCSYIGEIHSDQVAEKCGTTLGDEYFAELDHIEVAEKMKDGYEASVVIPDGEISNKNTNKNSEIATCEDENSSLSNSSIETWSDSDSENSNICPEGDQLCFVGNENLPSPEPMDNVADSSNFKIRKYFGEDNCYVMDAKNKGNIARYFNHSCNPNVFTQNVFTETHDLRFPVVAFFTSCHVKAGTELTWDYNYKINSVENKVLYCFCGSRNCRGRLL